MNTTWESATPYFLYSYGYLYNDIGNIYTAISNSNPGESLSAVSEQVNRLTTACAAF